MGIEMKAPVLLASRKPTGARTLLDNSNANGPGGTTDNSPPVPLAGIGAPHATVQ